MKYLFILVLLSMFFIACDNNSSGTSKCDNKCNAENEKTCANNTIMLCKKNDKGCLVLEKVKDCSTVCENGECSVEDNSCNPSCKNWQVCNNQVCETLDGKCVGDNDCKNNKICINHECLEQTTKIVKKKVIVGAGGKATSSSFKLKLNVGKVTTVKTAKSSNFKLKLGTSTISR